VVSNVAGNVSCRARIEDGRAGLPVPFRRLVLVGGRDLIPFRAYQEADAVVGRCLAPADDLSG
jgi:hypothetical protein